MKSILHINPIIVRCIYAKISHRGAISKAIRDTKHVICWKQIITFLSENWKKLIVRYTIYVRLMEQNWIVLRLRIRNLSKIPIQKAILLYILSSPFRFLMFSYVVKFYHSNIIIHRILKGVHLIIFVSNIFPNCHLIQKSIQYQQLLGWTPFNTYINHSAILKNHYAKINAEFWTQFCIQSNNI